MPEEKKRYTSDEKKAIVKLITEEGRTTASLANEYGIHENTIYKWREQLEKNPDRAFPGTGHAPDALSETERLKRRICELEQENEFLKKSVSVFCQEPAVKYAMIDQHNGSLSTKAACKALSVRRTGYYEWRLRTEGTRARQDRLLTTQIKDIFYASHRTYGARKIQAMLKRQGQKVGRKRIRRLMGIAGLAPVTWRKRVNTTDSQHALAVFPNLLARHFWPTAMNKVWVADFTYIPTDEGWLYACVFLDLYARRVVGWSVSKTIDRHLALDAFHKAVALRKPASGFIVHTDRGSQFASSDFRCVVQQQGGRQSMSLPGCPYDNACAESFFRSFKEECVEQHHFATRQQATDCVGTYLTLFYNHRRLHQSLGYLTPTEFEQDACGRVSA